MLDIDTVVKEIKALKERIIRAEIDNVKLSETDTRQGLINPLFRTLGWDFGDFNSVKSEVRHKAYNEPVDYAFYPAKSTDIPVLLLEAKSLGSDLGHPKTVKQLCGYLGQMGVQWGVLSDGNKYIMYNSKGGASYDSQRFLTLEIKALDTEDGNSSEELARKLIALLGRTNLENEGIQLKWEEHMINAQIEDALISLLSKPYATLASSIKREFKEERVKTNPNLKININKIEEYLDSISDEEGRIPIDFETFDLHSDEQALDAVSQPINMTETGNNEIETTESKIKTKRVTIMDLLDEKIASEGDNWKLEHKGEVFWGRITGNGELEINGESFSNPSRAGNHLIHRSCSGWYWWQFKDTDGIWKRAETLRNLYREKHGLEAIRRKNKTGTSD